MRALCILCALTLLVPRPAAAQAGTFEQRAKEHAAADRFDRAIEDFGRQYAETPEPRLLLYIAECYRSLYRRQGRADDLREARRHYRLYLDREPGGPLGARARDLLAVVEAELARLEAAGRPVQPPPPAPLPAPAPPPAPAPLAPPAAADTPPPRRLWPWIVLGAALAGVGAVLVLVARDRGGVDAPAGDFPAMRF